MESKQSKRLMVELADGTHAPVINLFAEQKTRRRHELERLFPLVREVLDRNLDNMLVVASYGPELQEEGDGYLVLDVNAFAAEAMASIAELTRIANGGDLG